MPIKITAFAWVPPFAQGYVRDLRVRWALEEAGLPYETVLIGKDMPATGAYRAWQPFGQVPAYRDDDVELFESGAIVLHIAATSPALAGTPRAASWVFAALTSIDPFVQNVLAFDGADLTDPAIAARHGEAEAVLMEKLTALSAWLGEKEFLEGAFSAGDLMMTMVLRELVENGMLARFANLDALRERCETRAAFKRALAAQLRVFKENEPK